MSKQRGAGQPPRQYSTWEWVRGYLAFALTLPIYLFLWLFAILCPKLPEWLRKSLLRSHKRTTTQRPADVRIPTDKRTRAYMLRWWRIPRNWAFNVYYHIVKRSDDDTALHDHPWWNFSIVLDGGYFEHRILPGGVHEKKWYGPGSVRFRPHGGFSHRLELDWEQTFDQFSQTADGRELPVKTIFITGPTLRRWGFHHTERWVDAYEWDDYTAERGISLDRMAGYAEQNNRTNEGPKT